MAGLTEHYRRAFDEHQARVLAEAAVEIESDLVRREDFSGLTGVVERLAGAQERTEARLGQLAEAQQRTELRMEQLTEAQQRTELKMEQLTEAQQRTEAGLKQLSEAQQRTELKLEQLTEAQKQSEAKIGQLAEAQERTEQEMRRLSIGQQELVEGQERLVVAVEQLTWTVRDMQKQVGGLSQTAGYAVEAYVLDRLPALLGKKHRFVETTAMPEAFTYADGSTDEIDVVLRGTIDGRPVAFVCEAKTNITPREVQDFLKVFDRVRHAVGCDDVRPIFFTYRENGDARQLIAASGAYLAFPHAIIVAPG